MLVTQATALVTQATRIRLIPDIMVAIPLTATPIQATATATAVLITAVIGAKGDALPGELIGDGIAGIRASAPPTKRLAQHVLQSPRLD